MQGRFREHFFRCHVSAERCGLRDVVGVMVVLHGVGRLEICVVDALMVIDGGSMVRGGLCWRSMRLTDAASRIVPQIGFVCCCP